MRKFILLLCAALCAAASALPRPARACTSFLVGQGQDLAMAKSYDWDNGEGLVIVNKRGVAKQGLPLKQGEKPATWISKYGSVTFNQYGREMPNGGLNEAGLAVEVLWLDSSVFPEADARPAVNELQFVQYLLDSFSTVAELIPGASRVRVARTYGAIHYFTCDKTGACAALEFLGGKLVVTSGVDLVAPTIANDSYADSAIALEELQKNKRAAPKGDGSMARFLRAATMLQAGTGADAPATAAMKILDSVTQGKQSTVPSQWNIVYELRAGKVHFRSKQVRKLKDIDLAGLDFTCASTVKTLDVNSALEGDVTGKLVDYSSQANEKLVRASLAKVHAQLPEAAIKGIVEYPMKLPCADAAP